MRRLHDIFKIELDAAIERMGKKGTYSLRHLPSATGCVKGSNPLLNAKRHEKSEFFYVTDLKEAYPSLDLHRLTTLLVFIFNYERYSDYRVHQLSQNESLQFELNCDPLFEKMFAFVMIAFAGPIGPKGNGLAVGGPLSPLLLNLYCEVYIDKRLVYHFNKYEDRQRPERAVIYTRFVDDLTFSRGFPIDKKICDYIRRVVNEAGFELNNWKTQFGQRTKQTVFITKIGLRADPSTLITEEEITPETEFLPTQPSILTFSGKKRRELRNIIQSFFALASAPQGKTAMYWNDQPEKIRGMIGEFVQYYRHVGSPTKSDWALRRLCREFEKEAGPLIRKMSQSRQEKYNRRRA